MIPIKMEINGDNFKQVIIGNLEIWFSYKTPVAFRYHGSMKISENLWGGTTGKHLNWLDGGNKEGRMPRREFEDALQIVLGEHNFHVRE